MKAVMSGLCVLALVAAQGPAMAQSQAHPDASKPAPNVHTLSQPEVDPCEVPGYILFGEGKLEHVKKAVEENKRLTILVVGSGSSVLPGTDGAGKAYPGRLEEVLRKRYPGVEISVVAIAKSRQTAADMTQGLDKALLDRKPDLVIWQTGTVDAMRGVDPESFRTSLDEGIDHIIDAGADLILMNMQYSPRTETMISLSNYADMMRVVARDREVPLFDRREIMRYWNDNGNFDLNLATKDVTTAYKVHDCLGRALASLVVEAANLDGIKARPTQ
ncbi:SGNH/GDSL hydrolase family protein [Pseudorhodoplanes sp.]|uniref:SGNH/GDSL hydrolase family protein n=1 Tax=Pseudorhodoplanes sp. TaxID=1934341 RepID=UPI002BBBCFB8|nr:SGNH/GDSL hydrolase family protein [Pseudorhodoplanes sp.]HWV51187.1 SGNH/GDSL hydrolase family protein [Pseudorhodoplanes sp.]